jgi:hypothetical protein
MEPPVFSKSCGVPFRNVDGRPTGPLVGLMEPPVFSLLGGVPFGPLVGLME